VGFDDGSEMLRHHLQTPQALQTLRTRLEECVDALRTDGKDERVEKGSAESLGFGEAWKYATNLAEALSRRISYDDI
jgi:hypothetical protein